MWVVGGIAAAWVASIILQVWGKKRAEAAQLARNLASIEEFYNAYAQSELAKAGPGATFVFGASGKPTGIELPPDYWEKQRARSANS